MDGLDYLLAEARNRARARDTGGWEDKAQLLLDSCHERQRWFVEDPSRRIAALIPRGGGKTTALRTKLLRQMLLVSRSRCLFVALSRPTAEKLVWRELHGIDEDLELRARFHESKLMMTLPNASQLQLVGANDHDEIEKLRGVPYHGVGIDEAASFYGDRLTYLIDEVIAPRLGDYRGFLCLIGTPSKRGRRDEKHVFYNATTPGSPIARPYIDRDKPDFANWDKWSTHRWLLPDNDRGGHNVGGRKCAPGCRAAHLWEEALVIKAANGWTDETPQWRREYCGEWISDDTGYVFKFRPTDDDGKLWNVWEKPNPTDLWSGLDKRHDWRFVIGLDMGHSDPFAVQVLAFSDTFPTILQTYAYTKPKMELPEIGKLIKALVEKIGYYPDAIVADTAGMGGAVLGYFLTEFGLKIEAAEKKHKNDAIEVINGDFIDGRLKLIKGSPTAEQIGALQWDETGMKIEGRNDLADALIYARRAAQHRYVGELAPARAAPGSQAAIKAEIEENERRLDEKLERSRHGDTWDDDFGSEFAEFAVGEFAG